MISEEAADAKSAGLRYVDDGMPGFTRKRVRGGFEYFDVAGKRIRNAAELERIASIAIPPAYDDVWICPSANGHVQATARDARGRKQYRYHKRWREVRDEGKYTNTIAFAKALPTVRARVIADLDRECMDKEKVLATVVRLLEDTSIRIGNEDYAKDNGSFGLTTLRPRHVRIEGASKVRIKFRGKSGIEHLVTVDDARLARTVRRCRNLPGEELFSYRGDDDAVHPIHSDDVNDYLRETTTGDFSAKDYRTWAGTVTCALALERIGPAQSVAEAKRNLTAAFKETAERLGNTPAVVKKAYVHPSIVETYLDDLTLALPPARGPRRKHAKSLDPDERRVLAFLERAAKRSPREATLRKLERSVASSRSRSRR